MPLIVAEPPNAYARPKLVVDASVVASVLFAEPEQEQAVSWMRARTLCAPYLIDFEIANVALNKVRCKLLAEAHAGEALRLLAGLGIERVAVDLHAAFELATRTGLTAYDAAYLWVAQALNAPLATFDERLGAAALRQFRGPPDR